jgi:hypothetical protein
MVYFYMLRTHSLVFIQLLVSAQRTGEGCQRFTVIGQQRLIVELLSQNNTCVIWSLPKV